MEDDRLWKFRKPAWLNSAWARGAGVYSAGALVRYKHLFGAEVPVATRSTAYLPSSSPLLLALSD